MLTIADSRDEAANYYYVSRLTGEASEGIAGFQVHPLEPRAVRLTLAKQF